MARSEPGIDLRTIVAPGDHILWGQGTGEPQTLTEALVAQRADLGGVSVFLGSTFSTTLRPEHADHIHFTGIGGIGGNAVLARAGVLDVIPCHISSVPRLIAAGELRVDVVFVQLAPAGPDGRHSLGLVADYVAAAIAKARVVVAEINDQVPRTRGETGVGAADIDHAIHTSRPPVMVPTPALGPPERRIGELVAELVPDRAVLQLGIGSVPGAVAGGLADRRDLSVHGGVIGDWIVDLMESGVVTNVHKPIDAGVTTTGAVFGTRRLYDYVDDNPAIRLRPISYTHSPQTLARLDRLIAVNGAVEVDLTGQVNAETLRGVHIGAVAGQVDFVRAAMASAGGRSIIALRSTARGGEVTRIVSRLADGVVTTPRSDADVVITEHGVAHLRGVPLPERARRLIAIADPLVREALTADLPDILC
jgi:acetyl-CoA hydrolase